MQRNTFPGFKRNPRVACTTTPLRIWLLTKLREWRATYHSAFSRWRTGKRRVVFPHGVVDLRRYHHARVGDPADPPPRELLDGFRAVAA